MADATEWKYTVQLHDDVRLYRMKGEYVEKRGIAWSLTRSCERSTGPTFHQSIVVSAEVFDDEEEAKHDALERLSMLRCPLELPVDRAIKWMLNDG